MLPKSFVKGNLHDFKAKWDAAITVFDIESCVAIHDSYHRALNRI